MAKLHVPILEQIEALERERNASQALSWPNFPKPQPLSGPESYADNIVVGWANNLHTKSVCKIWQDSVCSYRSADLKDGSRCLEVLYATEQEAMLALIHEATIDFAQQLAELWKRLRQLSGRVIVD